MKNSLFKRAFAAASVVPLALTQCLSVANAININDSVVALTETANFASGEEITLDNFLFIEPGAFNGKDGYIIFDADGNEITDSAAIENAVRFEKDSDWNIYLWSNLMAGDKEGDIPFSTIYEEVINRAGSYSEVVKNITDKIGDGKYTIDEDGNITITASFDNVVPVIEDYAQDMLNTQLQSYAEEYGVTPDVTFFEGIEIAGSIEIEVDSAALQDGTKLSAKVTFTDENGKVYNSVESIAAYVQDKIDALNSSAQVAIDNLKSEYDPEKMDFNKKAQESDEFQRQIDEFMTGYTPKDDEVEAMVKKTDEFKGYVSDYMDATGANEEEAEKYVTTTAEYNDMIEKIKGGISLDSYSRDEIVAMVIESDEYHDRLESFKEDYRNDIYPDVVSKADDAKNKIDSMMTKASNTISTGVEKYESVNIKELLTFDKRTFVNYEDIANTVNNSGKLDSALNKVPDSISNKLPDSIPTSLVSVASNPKVQKIFTEIINKFAFLDNVNITPEDLAKFIESAEHITISGDSGIVTYGFEFPDSEKEDAKTYIEDTYPVEVDKIYKEAEFVVDLTALESGEASVDFQLKRVVEVTPKTTTTTSTSTTETSTTTTDSDVTTTTTDSNVTTTTTDS
ncbi:MAG: hypothetical protein K2H19_08000, partial [Ruminococcus sp.]|nr:hypothetical protein [Ruminococcus sp.]